MTKKEIQEKRIELIQDFISNRNKQNNPPNIIEIIQTLDNEGLFEELNNEKYLDDDALLEKKKNVFRNILKTHQNIKCNKAKIPTYYLTKEKRLTDKAKRLKTTLENFDISEPLSLGTPILNNRNENLSSPIQPCGIYFIHKDNKSNETIKYHLNTLIYRLEMNFKTNALFTELKYLDIQLMGERGCLLTLRTPNTAIECYNRLCQTLSNTEPTLKEDD